MADNSGSDAAITKQEASEGGQHSSGQFGRGKNDPSAAGKKGAEAQPRGAKAEGGRNSNRGDGDLE